MIPIAIKAEEHACRYHSISPRLLGMVKPSKVEHKRLVPDLNLCQFVMCAAVHEHIKDSVRETSTEHFYQRF